MSEGDKNPLDDVPGPGILFHRRIIQWVIAIVGIIVVGVLVIGGLGLALDWFSAGKDIVSPENVREQYRFFYDTIEDLEKQAGIVCIAEDALERAEGESARNQRDSQLIAAMQVYEGLVADYDARARDVFRGEVVKPGDVPDEAPTLEESKANSAKCQDN